MSYSFSFVDRNLMGRTCVSSGPVAKAAPRSCAAVVNVLRSERSYWDRRNSSPGGRSSAPTRITVDHTLRIGGQVITVSHHGRWPVLIGGRLYRRSP